MALRHTSGNHLRTGGAGYGAPAAFTIGQWTAAGTGVSGVVHVTISTLPSLGGASLADIQYTIDGGTTWISTGLTSTGSFDITGLTDNTVYSIQIRAVTAGGVGAASDTKTATPVGKTLTFAGALGNSDSPVTITGSLTIAAGTVVVVTSINSLEGSDPTVVVGGVSLTKRASFNDGATVTTYLYDGVLPTGGSQTVLITFLTGAFLDKYANVWGMTGLSSSAAAASGGAASASIPSFSVTSGDFLVFGDIQHGASTFSGTQAPTAFGSTLNSGAFYNSDYAYWTVAATSASFSIGASAVGGSTIGIYGVYR